MYYGVSPSRSVVTDAMVRLVVLVSAPIHTVYKYSLTLTHSQFINIV